jgi:hypothetical protein
VIYGVHLLSGGFYIYHFRLTENHCPAGHYLADK